MPRKADIAVITKAYIRHYRENGQLAAYVEWIDAGGRCGRTEEIVSRRSIPASGHMVALMKRAVREGVTIERQDW